MTLTVLHFSIMLLILLITGIFADRIFRMVALCTKTSSIYTSLIFSLVIYLIDIWGLFVFKIVTDFQMLVSSFNWLRFSRKFILLSLLIALVIGGVSGIFGWLLCRIRKDT